MSGRFSEYNIRMSDQCERMEDEYSDEIAALKKRFHFAKSVKVLYDTAVGVHLIIDIGKGHDIRIGNTEHGELVSQSDSEHTPFFGGYFFEDVSVDYGVGGRKDDLVALAWAIFTAVRD